MRKPRVGHRAGVTVRYVMLRKIKSRRTARLRNAPSGDSDEETRSRPLGSNYGKTMRVVPYRTYNSGPR